MIRLFDTSVAIPPPTTVTAMTQIVLRLMGGNAPIRGMNVPGKGNLFSVYDFMWNTGAYASKSSVTKAFSRMIAEGSDVKEEVASMCHYLKFPGPGQKLTPCSDVVGFQRILCLMGGKVGKEYRELATTTLIRVAAGDMSMIEEIESNSVSEEPVQQLARKALAAPSSLAGPPPDPYVLARVAGTEMEAINEGTRSMRAFGEERRELLALLEASVPILERDLQLERERAELPMAHKRAREEYTAMAINEFLGLSIDKRKAMRPVLMSQLEEIIPATRARALFVGNLMKMPLPAGQPSLDPVVTAPDPPVVPPECTSGVYVLKLTNGKFYVGQSRNIPARIEAHKNGSGAVVVRGSQGSVQVACITPRPIPEDLEAWERSEVLERMYQYGIENVRGWIYSSAELGGGLWSHAFQQVCSKKGLCHRCGRAGHFAGTCRPEEVKVVFGAR